MTASDMERLLSALSELSAEELTGLDDATRPWTLELRRLPPNHVHAAVFDAVKAVHPESHRLQCIAWLYCWMVPRRPVHPWALYRNSAAPTNFECIWLLQRTVYALRFFGIETTYMWNKVEDAVHCCLLILNTLSLPRQRSVVYAVMWPDVALMAVHASDVEIRSIVLTAVLTALPDDLVEIPDVPRDLLWTALSAGMRIPAESSTHPEAHVGLRADAQGTLSVLQDLSSYVVKTDVRTEECSSAASSSKEPEAASCGGPHENPLHVGDLARYSCDAAALVGMRSQGEMSSRVETGTTVSTAPYFGSADIQSWPYGGSDSALLKGFHSLAISTHQELPPIAQSPQNEEPVAVEERSRYACNTPIHAGNCRIATPSSQHSADVQQESGAGRQWAPNTRVRLAESSPADEPATRLESRQPPEAGSQEVSAASLERREAAQGELHDADTLLNLGLCESSLKSEVHNGFQRTEHNEAYQCSKCTYSHAIKRSVRRHEKIHTADKNFMCDICGKKFALRTYLRDHMKIHSAYFSGGGEKTFVCTICGRKFALRKYWKVHLKAHSAPCYEEGKKCPHCGRFFRYRNNLDRHLRYTCPSIIVCPHCPQRFYDKADIEEHLKSHPTA